MQDFLSVKGARLRVEEAGSGLDLLFIHAGIADRRMWDPQWEWLTQHFHCVRFDQRGLGESALVKGPFSYVDDALAVMDAFHLEQATLMGCSFGGSVAVHLAISQPGRVARLVLVASGLAGYDAGVERPGIFAEAERAFEAKDWERVLDIDETVWVIGLRRRKEDIDPAFLSFVREMNRTSLAYTDVDNESRHDFDDDAALPGLDLPVLVVVGTEDLPEVLATAAHLEAVLPQATLRTVHDAAHLPNLERSHAFNEILVPFLGVALP